MIKIIPILIERLYNLFDIIHAKRIKKFYSSKQIDLVIDVGSHKGEFINLIAPKDVPIYSFEPQISVRDELIKNCSKRNVIEFFDFAVSDHNGEIELFLNNLTSTTSIYKSISNSKWIKFKKMLLGGELYAGKQMVKVTTLDNVLLDKIRPNHTVLLKIDVEGAEAAVLKGAYKLFNKCNIKYVQIESANYRIYDKNLSETPLEILNIMGYTNSKKFLFPLLNFSDLVFEKK